jgi:putative phage-type endonuclease
MNMNTDVQLIQYETRSEWLAARQFGIGASESAAIFGLAPDGRESAYSLWAKKAGLVSFEDSENEYLKAGELFEEPIAQLYQWKTGHLLWTPPTPFCIVQHPRLPFLTATIDRWIIEAQGRDGRGDLEIKNVGAYNSDWKDEVPLYVQAQVQHQLACTDLRWAAIAALVGGNRMETVYVERNEDFIAELEARAVEFWGRVERKDPPPADGSEATAKTLKRLHPDDDGSTVELDESTLVLVEELELAKARKSAAEKDAKDADNKLRALIGKATFGKLTDGRTISLKTTERAGYVVEATKYRTLRIEKAKAATRKG